MRLVTFRVSGDSRLGVVRDQDEVVEIAEPADMQSLVDAGEQGLVAARAALSSSKAKAHRLADVELLSPLPEPRGNIIAIGRNYQKHAEQSARKEGYEPQPPTVFTKAITSLTEPFADIAIDPSISDQIDWKPSSPGATAKGARTTSGGRLGATISGTPASTTAPAPTFRTAWAAR